MARTLLILFVTFCGFVDTHLLIPIIALYAKELTASVTMVGLAVGIYSIVNTPANLVLGRVIDRVGRKWPLLFGLVADAVCMFAYSLCRLPVHLFLVRAFHGASGGLIGPATMSLMADHASAERRGGAMGAYGVSLGMAALIGIGASGVMALRLGYAPVFYLGSVLLLLGAAAAFLHFMVSPHAPVRVGGSLRQDVSRFAALLRRRRLIASYYAVCAQYFAFGAVVTLLPLYVEQWEMNTFHVSMLLATCIAVFMLVQLPGGALSDRIGRRLPSAVGLLLVSAALCAIPLCTTFASLALLMAIYGAGWGLLFPAALALILDATTAEERGIASGGLHAMITAGVAIGAPVMGGVAGLVGLEWGLGLSAVVTITGMIIVLAFVGQRR